MLRRSRFVPMVLVVTVAFPLAAQVKAPPPNPPGVSTVLTIDSTRVGPSVNVSPDGRWIVYARNDDDDNAMASIWMASTTNPKPFRITSPGYSDRWPEISPSGDALYFVSNRPGRTSRSTALYVMAVSIDRTTGQPVGPVRQVTTDSVAITGNISPDGKWLVYEPRGGAPLKIVSTSGGNARTLVTRQLTGPAYVTFSADGKFVVYQDSGAALRKVSVAGGPAMTLVAPATTTRWALPYPGRDDRYLYEAKSDADTLSFEVRDFANHTLAAIRLPKFFEATAHVRKDGRGLVGVRSFINSQTFALKRIDLSTGVIQQAFPVSDADLVGEAPDGSVVLHHAVNGREHVVTVAPGGKRTEVALGPEAEKVLYLLPGGTKFLAFGKDTTRWPKDSFPTDPVPLYAVDRVSGASRKLADVVEDEVLLCDLRDFESDRHALELAEIRGAATSIETIDANGVTHLAGSIPLGTFERLRDVASSGTRVAYADSAGKNASTVYIMSGSGTAPRRVANIPSSSVAMSWSPDGRKLAILYGDTKRNVRATVRVLDIAADGTPSGPGLALDVGAEDVGFEASLAWVPDGSAIVVDRGSDYDDNVSLRSLDPARPAVVWPDVGDASDLVFEPGGKTALFSVGHAVRGSMIWTADFAPVKQP